MAMVTRTVAATPDQVWEVLCDGWLYAVWVVGASQIRNVDEGWPAVGTRIHHSVGAWPLLISDETEVLSASRPDRLVLATKARPAGTAEVTITVRADGDGSTVMLKESPTGGPGRWLHNPLSEALLMLRNREALKRLAAIAENRNSPAGQ